MAPPSKVSVADVAAAAGVSPSTVSRALRNHPDIPRTTCERIQALALEMGYRPDPLISALLARRYRKGGAEIGTIAFLTTHLTRDGWRKSFNEKNLLRSRSPGGPAWLLPRSFLAAGTKNDRAPAWRNPSKPRHPGPVDSSARTRQRPSPAAMGVFLPGSHRLFDDSPFVAPGNTASFLQHQSGVANATPVRLPPDRNGHSI